MTSLLKMHVGRGEQRGPLTLFPIWHERTEGPAVQLADDHTLAVGELPSPEVPHLRVAVRGSLPVLLLDGAVLKGGWQDRIAVGSTLLAPGKATSVDVRCVEQQRWSGRPEHVVGTARASSFVRGQHDQYEVWRRVAVERGRPAVGVDVRGLQSLPGQTGVLIGVGGVPTLLEVFADERLFAAAWPGILAAAALEAAGRPGKATGGYRARDFIGVVESMQLHTRPGTGAGRSLTAALGPLELRGVADGTRLLHASVLNRAAWNSVPTVSTAMAK